MTIATFYNDVRTAIGRGAANDGNFQAWAQEALSLLENEHTYRWMRHLHAYALVPAANSNVVPLGFNTLKAVDWARFALVVGTGATQTTTFGDLLTQVEPDKFTSIDNGYAGAYYFDGVDTIVLDALPQEASTLQVWSYDFTQWPSDTALMPPILARHYQGFKAHFMMTAAGNLRDASLGQIWQGASQRGVQAILAADGVMEWAGRRGLRMGGSQSNT